MTDLDRLRRVLGGEDLAWLVARVRRRLERGLTLETTATLTGPTPGQRAAIQRLLGRAPRAGASLSVPLLAVDEVLRRSATWPGGLAAAVVALTGPLVDRNAAAAASERAWQSALAPVEDAIGGRPALAEWLAEVRRSGVVRRLAGDVATAEPLLADLAAVIRALPAGGDPIGEFAARVCGSAHALDDGRPLATLALGAARALSGAPRGQGAHWRRDIWAAVGIVRDELSSTVLTLGLPGDTTTATGRAIAAWHDVGQPCVLTLRHLRRDPPKLDGLTQVFVCENPVVVSTAANQLGTASAPLICTGGQPGAAVIALFRLLTAAGANLRYHGDFDWGGIRIANTVFEHVPVIPWRFTTVDYRAATRRRGSALSGKSVAASWDADLAPAMSTIGARIEEERVMDDLITDLDRRRP